MRIGLFSDTYPPFVNGVSTSVEVLKKALEQKGHKVYVVTVNNHFVKYDNDEKQNILRVPGIPVGIYDYRLTNVYPIKAMNKIRKWKLDIIHTHTEFGIGTFARVIAKQYNIPLVHTYHTMYEDYAYYITKGHFDKSSKKILAAFTKFYCDKTVEELIVPTEKTKELFETKYKLTDKVNVVPTGVDLQKFYRDNQDEEEIARIKKRYGLTDQDFVVLFVGRLAKEKNVMFLIDAQKKLLKTMPNAKLLIVGDGPLREELENKVNKDKLDDSIIFTGKVPFDKIGAYYACANVLTTASKTETQGLTVLEAMAAGVTPVCIEDDSFKLYLTHKDTGLFFKNEKEYINMIALVNSDKDLHEKMLKNASVKVNESSSEKYAENVIEIYTRVLDKHKEPKKGFLSKLGFNRGKDK